MKAIASFQTNSAGRYLSMLCTHLGKRFKAHGTKGTELIQFPFGRCELTAGETELEIRAYAEDQTQLDQVVQVVTSHLERFAFRENPVLDWQDPQH